MIQASFELECDRLSGVVDHVQFERLRWARTEAPMLARLVTLLHSALDCREDFELTEEGSTQAVRRYMLKIHSSRILAITLGLDKGRALVGVQEVERGKFRFANIQSLSGDFADVDENWMAAALQELFCQIKG
jgi:hypothetical protein